MAKKVIATFKAKGGKGLVKLIKTVRSSRTGANSIRESIVESEAVKDIILLHKKQ